MTIEQGIAHQQAGRLAEAESVYRGILSQQPDHADALHLLGTIAIQCAKPKVAIDLIQRAISLNPSIVDYHVHLAQVFQNTGRVEDAIQAFRQAIALSPGNADLWNRLAILFHRSWRLPEAIEAYRQAVSSRPDFPDAQNNLGTALVEFSQPQLGIEHLRRAIELRPIYPEAHNNLGNALQTAGRLDEAMDSYRVALSQRPGYAEVYNNLGSVLRLQNKPDEAIVAFNRALELQPNYTEARNSMGVALLESGRFDEAFAAYRKALSERPDYAESHQNLGMAMLLRGDFANGWNEYEWRWQTKELSLSGRNFPQRRWHGEELTGRRILLHAEQGFGDTIQFIRYLPLVAQRGGKIILGCQKELMSLLKQYDQVEQFITQGEALPPFDVHCALLSLPLVFKTDLQSIPASVGYLKADANLTEKWQQRIGEKQGLKVGLCWSGRSTHKRDRSRSIRFDLLSPIMRMEGIQCYSLQKGESNEVLIDWTNELDDFAQTAALIQNLDLIITVDTAIAHLAGALGKPVWVLLPLVPDWRWLLEREDSPWYPTMRLFRQRKMNDWNEPIERVMESLRTME